MERAHSPSRETQPPPSHPTAETPDQAHAPGPRGSQRTTTTVQRAKEGDKGGRAPSPSTHTPSPPHEPTHTRRTPPHQGHTTDCQCAPSASDHHTRHRRAGDAGQRGHSDHPAVGKTRDPTHTRASTPEQGATAGQGSGEITGAPPHPACNSGNGQVAAKQATGRDRGRPGSKTHQGTAPGSSRQRAD